MSYTQVFKSLRWRIDPNDEMEIDFQPIIPFLVPTSKNVKLILFLCIHKFDPHLIKSLNTSK